MSKPISPEIRKRIQELFTQGNTPAEIARRTSVSYTTAYMYTVVARKGQTRSDYELECLQKRDIPSHYEYRRRLAQKRDRTPSQEVQERLKAVGIPSEKAYREILAKGKGYDSDHDLQKENSQRRKQKEENIQFSKSIKEKLESLGKSRYWLAKTVGISPSTVYKYYHGISIPSPQIRNAIESTLGIETVVNELKAE